MHIKTNLDRALTDLREWISVCFLYEVLAMPVGVPRTAAAAGSLLLPLLPPS